MGFWQGFIGLSALAGLFLLWPTLFVGKDRRRALYDSDRADANSAVYEDHLKELEQTWGRGEIGATEFKNLKLDLEKTLVSENTSVIDVHDKPIVSNFRSRLPVISVALIVPLFAFAFYSQLGSKADWEIYQLMTERKSHYQGGEESLFKQSSEGLIKKLQDRLASNPDNTQNWYLLASTAQDMGRFDEAVRAFRQLIEREPDAAQVRADLAQALFLQAGNTVTPEVREHTNIALTLNPDMPSALGLSGIDAFKSGQYNLAIGQWQKALGQLDPHSPSSQWLSEGIQRAKKAAKTKGVPIVEESKKPSLAVSVSVSIDGKKVKAEPSDTVFVYARAWQGPKMPLAIQRLSVADLPKRIILDQSMSMAPGMDLSAFPQVEIVARISKAGSAIPQSGDWLASDGPFLVAEHKKLIKLKISEQIP